MASHISQSKLSIKLMVHKKEKRVIFAEADGNFVDTLFSIMTLPMATIVRLLRKLPDEKIKPIIPMNCMSAEENKWMLLNPRTSSYDTCKKLKLNINDQEPTKHFICQDIGCSRRPETHFSICNLARCSHCGKMMDREITYEGSTAGDKCDGGVFVSDLTSYIVTDDLRVMPNSPGSTLKLLCELGITDVSCFEDMAFDIGLDQILILLKGALLFKYPLTYMVFPSSLIIQDLANPRQETSFKHLTSKESTETSKSFMLKVTIQKSASKFLFAEADSDFVEFLFGFLEIPLGTLIGDLMNCASSFETLNNLFASINLNMFVEDSSNLLLLIPELLHKYLSANQIFPIRVFRDTQSYCHSYMKNGTFCANMTRAIKGKVCYMEMLCKCSLKDSRVKERYLKPSTKFVLTDDLIITPLSSFSTTTMLFNLKVPLNDVEEHEISIGIEEGLEILDASLKSLSALMDSVLKRTTETKN